MDEYNSCNYKDLNVYLSLHTGITTSTTNSINRYGLLKLNYIKKHKKQLYRNLPMNNHLTDYLSSVSNECNIKFETIMNRIIIKMLLMKLF
ncbi:TnpV protein [Coprobacillus cateniformis]|uniref:TnpV protein n=1 Tax=Coprobacillus cateniformis TaxID=100884 RepID=UPI00356B4D18